MRKFSMLALLTFDTGIGHAYILNKVKNKMSIERFFGLTGADLKMKCSTCGP
jgi:hypothetical protein